MEDIIEKGIQQKYIRFSEDRKFITYIYQNKTFSYLKPEEKTRAEAFLSLILNYGYKAQYIDLEVKAKQGSSGKTSADIVVFEENPQKRKGFLTVEVKAENTKEKTDEIRKQARSYARSEEINCQLYAYKIGEGPFVAYKTNGRDIETKIPYRYTKQCVYAYIIEEGPIPDQQKHYENLSKSTPHELKRIFGQCHNEIWQSGEKGKEEALEEFNKMLFLKLYDEIEKEKAEKHLWEYAFQTRPLETKQQLKDRIVKNYNEAIKGRKVDDLLKPINLNAYQIYFIVEKLQSISLSGTDKDPKGLAFETYTENHMKGEFGQYFTPRNIVEFMVSISPIKWDDNFSSNSKVLDPTCGSGSFLTHSLSQFKERFKNPKNWQDFATNSLFGIEINEKISVSAKINYALHDDGHDNVIRANGLNIHKLPWSNKNYDLILTNPPFGGETIKNLSNKVEKQEDNLSIFYDYESFEITRKFFDEIDILRGKVKTTNQYTDAIRPEHIFFELYYKSLKEGGIAEVIVPDGVLTNSTTQYLRTFIETHFRIMAIISLPQFTFSHYGAGVKASIIIIKKLPIKTTEKILGERRKYLKSAISKYEDDLNRLEERKKNIENEHIEIIKIRQNYKEQARIIQESYLFNNDKKFVQNEIRQIEKDVNKKIKEFTNLEKYKEWKKEKTENINEEIKSIKELIYEQTRVDFNMYEKDLDYPIFMVIAEHIGYDATGRETEWNDLKDIIFELNNFLKTENGRTL